MKIPLMPVAMIIALLCFTISMIFLISVITKAHALTPYQSGYKHGLNDPDLKEVGQNHTQTFNQGYIDGWCSLPGNGPYSGSDSDQGTFECQYDATQSKNSTR